MDTVPFEGGYAGFQFEDRGWIQFQDSLKPLGLCASLIGSCKLENKDFYHKIDGNKYEWIKNSSADQICFCSLGKVLGFQPLDIAEYEALKYFLMRIKPDVDLMDGTKIETQNNTKSSIEN